MFDNLSNLIINKVYSATTMYNDNGASAKRKNRPCWAIVIKYEGETVYYQSGKKIISNRNNPVMLPKGCDYRWLCTRPGHFIIIEFQSDMSDTEISGFNIRNPEKVLNIAKAAEHRRLIKSAFWEMASINDTYSIILNLVEQNGSSYIPSRKKQMIAPAIGYIAENYTKKISNDTLAGLIGCSTVYFRKLFREIYGIPPIEYVKELRIKKAEEMLRSDHGSITDIALALGYANIYDFSRDFKKRTGISPRGFAKRSSCFSEENPRPC